MAASRTTLPSRYSIHTAIRAERTPSPGPADLRFKCPDSARTVDSARQQRIKLRVRTVPPGSVPVTDSNSEHECSWSRDSDDVTVVPEGSALTTGQQDDREETIQGAVSTDPR